MQVLRLRLIIVFVKVILKHKGSIEKACSLAKHILTKWMQAEDKWLGMLLGWSYQMIREGQLEHLLFVSIIVFLLYDSI